MEVSKHPRQAPYRMCSLVPYSRVHVSRQNISPLWAVPSLVIRILWANTSQRRSPLSGCPNGSQGISSQPRCLSDSSAPTSTTFHSDAEAMQATRKAAGASIRGAIRAAYFPRTSVVATRHNPTSWLHAPKPLLTVVHTSTYSSYKHERSLLLESSKAVFEKL